MSIDRIMRVLQFGDSLLPIGSFSFSNALESAVQQGVVRDTATLGEFVTARELAKMGARILMAVAIPSAAPALWPAWRQ